MKTAVTMLGETFRQWQRDWESYDKGIGDKPKSYDEFISPFIELEKEQIINAHTNAYLIGEDNISVEDANEASIKYYNQTYNQNK